MFALAIAICLLLFVALSGTDMLVSNLSPDELNKMGIHRKS